MTKLIHWALRGEMRDFVINRVKAPLEKAIILAASLIPEPRIENTYLPNTHRLMAYRDTFLKYETNQSKRKLFEASWKILIFEIEHDPYYRDRFNWLIEMIANDPEWKPRSCDHPNGFWAEPAPYGGGTLIKR